MAWITTAIFEEARKEWSDTLPPWSFTRVLTEMYGFTLQDAEIEAESLSRPDDHHALSAASKSRRILIEEDRARLRALLFTINAIRKSSEIDGELAEAESVMMEGSYRLEHEIFLVVYDLFALVSDHCNQEASKTFQGYYRWKFKALRQRRGGRVPVVVYRILNLLEGNSLGSSGIVDGEDGTVRRRRDIDGFFSSKTYEKVMERIYTVIFCLMSVLYINGGLSCKGMSEKEAVIGAQEIFEKCCVQWRGNRTRINDLIAESLHLRCRAVRQQLDLL